MGSARLVEALVGQRPRSGRHKCGSWARPTTPRREENRRLKVRSLPEEPLRNACVATLSVAENMALRDFDQAPLASSRAQAAACALAPGAHAPSSWIADYGIKTQGEGAPIAASPGGNVQRAVLARELAGDINVLIAANPVFGLDFAAVREIHTRHAPGARPRRAVCC
jgi:ABC-type uncharacterized transport system ATPase subunit